MLRGNVTHPGPMATGRRKNRATWVTRRENGQWRHRPFSHASPSTDTQPLPLLLLNSTFDLGTIGIDAVVHLHAASGKQAHQLYAHAQFASRHDVCCLVSPELLLAQLFLFTSSFHFFCLLLDLSLDCVPWISPVFLHVIQFGGFGARIWLLLKLECLGDSWSNKHDMIKSNHLIGDKDC